MTVEQLTSLQSRLAKCQGEGLVEEAECVTVMDLVADFIELRQSLHPQLLTADIMNVHATIAGRMHALVGLSTGLVADADFARQLRRKFA